MTQTYVLINKAMTVFATFNTIVPPTTDNPIPRQQIGASQSFQLTVKGNPGATVSATVQLYTSNDGINFAQYLDPISVGGVGYATAGWGGSEPWNFFTALLTEIGGTNAKATLVLNG